MTTTLTATQEEMDLSGKAPEFDPSEVAALCSWLRGRGWKKAREIEAELGIDERKVRVLAEHSDGEILSGPGCPGYRLFDGETSLGDAERAARRLRSQGEKMISRSLTIARRMHRYGRAA
jgi:hypothetical protein